GKSTWVTQHLIGLPLEVQSCLKEFHPRNAEAGLLPSQIPQKRRNLGALALGTPLCMRRDKQKMSAASAGALAAGALAAGAFAVGALAVGALAIGALAVGRLVIGRLAVGKTSLRSLEIAELSVGRLNVKQLEVTGQLSLPPAASREGA
ncbi:MAG TPA: hypothetical protein VF493_16790, partial [Terriglobales bacterium]